MTRGCLVVIVVAACGGDDGGGGTTDAPPADAPVDGVADASFDAMIDAMLDGSPPLPIEEPPDCGGDPLVAHGGDLSLVVSGLRVADLAEGFDLDSDGDPDNKLAAIGSIANDAITVGLEGGTLVMPVEIFDRDGDPDACVKLGLYSGACGGPCDLTDGTQDTVTIDPASLGTGDVPLSRLRSMSTDAAAMVSSLGGFIRITLPVQDTFVMPLPITVQLAEGSLAGSSLTAFRFGGTMQSFRLDGEVAPQIPELGTMPGDTMLDLIFANLLGPLLAMPQSTDPSAPAGCRTADVDLDQDGLESFCDSNPDDDIKRADMCIDGDGTVVMDGDGGVAHCTNAVSGDTPRFVDGVSAALVMTASPATIE